MDDSGILNIVPCGIICFTNEGTITDINDTLLRKLQYSKDELKGYSIEKILTLSSRIFYQTHFFPLLKLQGKATEIFLHLLGKNKDIIPVMLNAKQVNEEDTPLNICACIEVYERKKYEDEILNAKRTAEEALRKNEHLLKAQQELEEGKRELDKQLTQLKYRHKELLQLNDLVAHDLQEPVRKIHLYIDRIVKSHENTFNQSTHDGFAIILKAANRVQNVLLRLQEYMQLSTLEPEKVPIDLNDLVGAQLQQIATEYPHVIFSTKVDTLPVIMASPKQLSALFYQLLKNCFEFRSLERNLQLNIIASLTNENFYSSTEGKYNWVEFVSITIQDNGIGFNPKYKDLIFKILKKLDLKSKGLGFGLAISKRIAENHRGFISATAEENKGAKVTVVLPME